MMDEIFSKALHDLLAAYCAPSVVRAAQEGVRRDASDTGLTDATEALWQAIADSGFANAMVPESHGGAGLSMAEAFPLFEMCGRFVVPLPLAETMLARAWAIRRGLAMPETVLDLDWLDATARTLPQLPGIEQRLDTQALRAAVVAAQMAGALQRVLEMTLNFANERQQFGRALGKFQSIQHQLALMAEQTLAARMAAQMGCAGFAALGAALAGDPVDAQTDRLRAGIGKARASEAAVVVTDLAHSIHGAIGFTEAFDLQLFTGRLQAWRQTAGSESYWHQQIGEILVNQHTGRAIDSLRVATDVPVSP